jgi:hypothetical protein
MEATLAFVLALASTAQTPPPRFPPSVRSRETSTEERLYGDPEPVDVATLNTGRYHRQTVRTKGQLRPLDPRGPFFQLTDGNARVVIVPTPEIQAAVSRFTGERVEVIGLARDLVADQGSCRSPRAMRTVPQSQCEDPELPPTPDLTPDRGAWPPISVTIWSIVEISPIDAKHDGFATALGGKPGDTVRLRGTFAGADLDRTMEDPPPEADAWLLRSEGGAIWVIGKPPRGPGWRLDRQYRGDIGKPLEVEGKLVRCGSATCVRARRVSLAVPPAARDEER